MSETTTWREVRERGSQWGMLITVILYRFLGRWAAEPVLWGISAYFYLKDGTMRQVSRTYLQKVKGTVERGDVYQHYLSFARTSLDRFDVWSDRLQHYTFHFHGEEHILRLLESGRGAVLLGAHMGNFDTLRALAKRRGKKVHILTDWRNSRKFSGMLKRFRPTIYEGVLEQDATEIDKVFELKQAVERGEFVGLLGDRVASETARGARRVSPASFLGETAYFPQTPIIFAAHLECPVLLVLSLRKARQVYDLYIEPFADRIELDPELRDKGLGKYAAAYAARLEHYCRLYPLQWFNFYDFWRQPS